MLIILRYPLYVNMPSGLFLFRRCRSTSLVGAVCRMMSLPDPSQRGISSHCKPSYIYTLMMKHVGNYACSIHLPPCWSPAIGTYLLYAICFNKCKVLPTKLHYGECFVSFSCLICETHLLENHCSCGMNRDPLYAL